MAKITPIIAGITLPIPAPMAIPTTPAKYRLHDLSNQSQRHK
jgi:hypothetical protein